MTDNKALTERVALFVIEQKAIVHAEWPRMSEDHIKDEVMMRLARRVLASQGAAVTGEEWRCPKCGAQADERFDCCEVSPLSTPLAELSGELRKLAQRSRKTALELGTSTHRGHADAYTHAAELVEAAMGRVG